MVVRFRNQKFIIVMPYHIIDIISQGLVLPLHLNWILKDTATNSYLNFSMHDFLLQRNIIQDSDKDSDEQYHIETARQIYFLWILSQENTWISNLENLDLALIQSILLECGYLGFMIGFWISPKNYKICFWVQESVFRFHQKNALLVWHFSIWIDFDLVTGYE